MKQYERVQSKYNKASKALSKVSANRRKKYWKRVMDKILNRKVTKQITQEQKELQKIFQSVL